MPTTEPPEAAVRRNGGFRPLRATLGRTGRSPALAPPKTARVHPRRQEFLERKPGEHRSRSGGGFAHEPRVGSRWRLAHRQRGCDLTDDAIVAKAMREEERSAGQGGFGTRRGSTHTDPGLGTNPHRAPFGRSGSWCPSHGWSQAFRCNNVGRTRIGPGHLPLRLLPRSPSHQELGA
jgi:hypothetical protein